MRVYSAVLIESKIQVKFHLYRTKRHTERDRETDGQTNSNLAYLISYISEAVFVIINLNFYVYITYNKFTYLARVFSRKSIRTLLAVTVNSTSVKS
jgi:hypothetical protein